MEVGDKMNFKDLTGQKFGKLTVKNRAENQVSPSGKSQTRWNCKCDCGSDNIVVSGDYLKRSECPSCGCEAHKNRVVKNRLNNIGEKYGRLTIVNILWEEKPVKAVCKCDCGNDYIGVKADIVSGHTQSCGCLQAKNASAANTKDWSGCVAASGVEFVKQSYMNEKGQWVWECKCPLCENYFYELPAKVNNCHTTSCGCRIQSFGETYIQSLLEDFGIKFKTQWTFEDCKDIYVLRFDFAILYDEKLLGLIEYDGKQHFEPIEYFGGEDGFRKAQRRDQIKNTYRDAHNISLLRIPYTYSLKDIETKIYEYYLSLTTAGDMWQHVS